MESAKSLWVRDHSCPACWFEVDRDRNSAFEVQKLGLEELGIDYEIDELLGLGESEDTPAETALPTDTTTVSAQRVRQITSAGNQKSSISGDVIETGSHGLPDPG